MDTLKNKDIRKALPLLRSIRYRPLTGPAIELVARQDDPHHSPSPGRAVVGGGAAQIFSSRWSDAWREDCEFEELRIEDLRRSRGELVDEPDDDVAEESDEC